MMILDSNASIDSLVERMRRTYESNEHIGRVSVEFDDGMHRVRMTYFSESAAMPQEAYPAGTIVLEEGI